MNIYRNFFKIILPVVLIPSAGYTFFFWKTRGDENLKIYFNRRIEENFTKRLATKEFINVNQVTSEIDVKNEISRIKNKLHENYTGDVICATMNLKKMKENNVNASYLWDFTPTNISDSVHTWKMWMKDMVSELKIFHKLREHHPYTIYGDQLLSKGITKSFKDDYKEFIDFCKPFDPDNDDEIYDELAFNKIINGCHLENFEK